MERGKRGSRQIKNDTHQRSACVGTRRTGVTVSTTVVRSMKVLLLPGNVKRNGLEFGGLRRRRFSEEAVVRTDGLVGRGGFEVASLDDLGGQLSRRRVVEETQQDLRRGGVVGGAVGQGAGAARDAHQGAAALVR